MRFREVVGFIGGLVGTVVVFVPFIFPISCETLDYFQPKGTHRKKMPEHLHFFS